jgi:HPt (histidine-containing phosphotransfer) domain-containing protein
MPLVLADLDRLLQGVAGRKSPGAAAAPAPSPAALAAAAFDYAEGLRSVDATVVSIIKPVFFEQWPKDAAALEAAVAAADWQRLTLVAHSLKSTLRMFGAEPLAQASEQLEALAGQQRSEGVAELHRTLCDTMPRLLQALGAPELAAP